MKQSVAVRHNQTGNLRKSDYILIRVLCLLWTLACGVTDIYCTYKTFSGEVAVIATVYACLSVIVSVFCLVLSKSPYRKVAIAALGVDIALSCIATAVVLIWGSAASDIASASDLQEEWKSDGEMYDKSIKEADQRFKADSASYNICTSNAANGGFMKRSEIALNCEPLKPNPNNQKYQPTYKRHIKEPSETKGQAAHVWKLSIRIVAGVGVVACLISIGLLTGLLCVALREGRVETMTQVAFSAVIMMGCIRLVYASLSNETGQQPAPIVQVVDKDYPPALFSVVEADEKKAEKPPAASTQDLGNQGSTQPDTQIPSDTQDAPKHHTQVYPTGSSVPENPLGCYEGTYHICNGAYRLRKRKGSGWDLRYGGKPPEGEKLDVGYIEGSLGIRLVESKGDDQWKLADRICQEKGKQPAARAAILRHKFGT